MKNNHPQYVPAVDVLSCAAREDADRSITEAPSLAAWQRLERKLDTLPRGRRPLRLRLAALGLGAAALAAVTWQLTHSPHVAFTVEGAQAEAGYVHAVPATGARLRFTDGSNVSLAGGSRCLVVSTDQHGAKLRLEDGKARVHVVHRAATRWSVEAGPFEVLVTGTEFDVRWSGADEAFRVRMINGSVKVTGPLTNGVVSLRAGQELSIELRRKSLSITEPGSENTSSAPASPPAPAPVLAPTPTAAAAPITAAPVTAAPPSPPAPPTTASRAGVGRKVALASPAVVSRRSLPQERPAQIAPEFTPADWNRLVSSGQSRAVLSQAEAHGMAACLRELDGRHLSALADAARYSGDASLAREVLATQRSRFTDSEHGRRAAFLLGRMADDVGLSPAEAIRWYDLYLTEAPGGPYAAEALGRKMLALEKLSGRTAARPLAQEYLRRFPNGPYLLQARHIVEGS